MRQALERFGSDDSEDHFQFRRSGKVLPLHRFCFFYIPGNVILSLLCFLSVQVAARVHACESLTSHPRELCENKTLREVENCFSLFALGSEHLLYVKCLGLEHHL